MNNTHDSLPIKTHREINRDLCGIPHTITNNGAVIELKSTAMMQVDDNGLIHGGFIFGLADHAAMLAVNHPHVVLAGAKVSFHKPSRTGDTLKAEAHVHAESGQKRTVMVNISCAGLEVFTGEFYCVVTDEHVLKLHNKE